MSDPNVDWRVVEGFGDEWSRFDHENAPSEDVEEIFGRYFEIFPWDRLPANAAGFDLGCGSGRWAKLVAPRVGTLHLVDPSDGALAVAKHKLADVPNARFHLAAVDSIPLPDDSMDFGYSLGVLMCIPDTPAAIASCVRKLKKGAPFLAYIYYRFDNRPWWYGKLWQASEVLRYGISRSPLPMRYAFSQVMAASVYLPLSRTARALEKLGVDVANFPLSFYRDKDFYFMRNDALDRFGTTLEKRYTRDEIRSMMEQAGLENISFNERAPYWCSIGYRK
jgi:ubiquinone/menaquinone biosynthesis C-methylase UbiE